MPRYSTDISIIALISLILGLAAMPCAAADLGDQEHIFKQAETHWAFKAVIAPKIPQLPSGLKAHNAIDLFILSAAHAKGFEPAKPASPRVMVRRLFFDLIGLPPTIAEIERWTRDWSPAKHRQLVDHLLASQHHGEHWGRMWLDVARYADTKGYMAAGVERRYPFAYTYRDWVVGALNRDIPYDRFLKLQLAADLMQSDGITTTNDLAALGFLTVGSRFTGKTDLMIDDRIDVVTRGTLGLTASCARCHDHKYDPIPTADYYSLYGVFMNSREPKTLPLLARSNTDPEATASFEKDFAKLQKGVDDFVAEKHERLRQPETISNYLHFVIESRGMKRTKAFSEAGKIDLYFRVHQRWQAGLMVAKKSNLSQLTAWHTAAELYGDGQAAEAKAALIKLFNTSTNVNPLIKIALEKKLPESLAEFCQIYGATLAAADADEPHPDKPREDLRQVLRHPAGPTGFPLSDMVRYFNRGTRDKYRKLVAKVDRLVATSPGSPPHAMVVEDSATQQDSYVFIRGNASQRGEKVPRQFLKILDGPDRQAFTKGSGRLELAEKIASSNNPLTARVMVNRVWMHHFGKPLVDTPSDFGLQTPSPVQQELLDYLAHYLIEQKWSLKQLHRLITQSATYQQSSSASPETLDKDPENLYWMRAERRRLSFEAMRDSLLAVSGELDRSIAGRPEELEGKAPTKRRAIYGFVDRYTVAPTLRTFDFADPNLHAPKRPQTTVPQQALFFMNSPFVEARAQALADKAAAIEPKAFVYHLYRIVYGRPPSESELLAARAQKQYGLPELAQALLASNEFIFVD